MQQTQSFTSIKQDLLDSIKDTGIQDINGNTLPSNPDSIVFGVPKDKYDPSKGWIDLEIPETENADTKGKSVKKGSVINQNPLGAGLKDGALLAFKFQSEGEGDEMEVDGGWDVVIPSFEDEGGS